MPEPRPELIVVSGHQAGQRAVLMNDVGFVGRSSHCDMQIHEPFISRRHVKFQLAPGGWIVENTSPKAIRVNGKKYMMGRKAFLETGDVLAVGAYTEILFVSQDADPEETLQRYRQAHPASQQPLAPLPVPPEFAADAPLTQEDDQEPLAPIQPVGPAGPDARVAAPPPRVPPPAPPPARVPPPTPVSLAMATPGPAEEEEALNDSDVVVEMLDDVLAPTAEDILAQERKAKLKKYGILFGIYAVVLVVGIALISHLRNRGENDDERPSGTVPQLTEEDISDVLRVQMPPRSNNATLAQDHLEQARRKFVERRRKGNRYLCVQNYKLYLAYGGLNGTRAFTVNDERQYQLVLSELIDEVTRRYENAYVLLRDGNLEDARDEFRDVEERVPVRDSPTEDTGNIVFVNVQENLNYINRQLQQR